MLQWVLNISNSVGLPELIVVIPILISFFSFYMLGMQQRRRKAYWDFFYVESFARTESKHDLQLGYIGSGFALLLFLIYALYMRDVWIPLCRYLFYVLVTLGIFVYCFCVYYNKKPEKYELRCWRTKSKEARNFIAVIRFLNHGLFAVVVFFCIEIANTIPERVELFLVVLIIFFYLGTLADKCVIQHVLEKYTSEFLCITENKKIYAIITSSDKSLYCIEILYNDDGKPIFCVDNIKIFPTNTELVIKRCTFNGIITN